jgi:anti-anti-sigma factor
MRSERRLLLGSDLDCDSTAALETELDPVVADADVQVIVLDCRNLRFIDSYGFRVLLRTQQLLESQGRRLRVTNLSPLMRHTFDMMGVTGVVRVQPTRSVFER